MIADNVVVKVASVLSLTYEVHSGSNPMVDSASSMLALPAPGVANCVRHFNAGPSIAGPAPTQC